MTANVVRAALLSQQIYDPKSAAFTRVLSVGGVSVGLVESPGVLELAFAGSKCTRDFIRDFKAIPVSHPQLGIVHEGFLEGMDELFAAVRPFIQPGIEVRAYGHSLGCPHAGIFAGLCAVNGIKVGQLILFAPPRASYKQLRDILHAHVDVILAYRNGFDPVPEVPLEIPLLEPWVAMADLVQVNEWPADRLDPFEYHAIDLYLTAMKKLYPDQS